MRRRTSAWIAGTLGAGLTASIVLAQQIPSSRVDVGPRAGSGASGPSSSEPASLYGASGTRGARYLLRNGLDYLQYQQYERALKFLRDAEAKEKELSATERQDLKRGIEQAQAGLRASADATPAYALSDRSRRRNGFTPARPDSETAIAARPGPAHPEPGTSVAARTEWSGPVSRGRTRPDRAGREDATPGAVFGAVASRGAGRAPAEDIPGEPIRLASAEEASPRGAAAPAPDAGASAGTSPSPADGAAAQPAPDPQAARSEIPALAAPGIPTLTAVPSSPDASRPNAAEDGPAEPAPASDPTGTAAASIAPAQAPHDPAPAPGMTGPAPKSTAPAPIPNEAAPAPILLETPDSQTTAAAPAQAPARTQDPTPAPAVEAPAGSGAPAVESASSPAAPPISTEATPALAPASDATPGASSSPAPPTGGLVPAAMQEPATPGETKQPAASDAAIAPAGGTANATPAPALEPAPSAAPAPASGSSEIPPLPSLGAAEARPAESGGPPHREDEQPALAAAPAPPTGPGAMTSESSAAPATAAPGTDELPPLPSDLGRDSGAAPSPAQPAPGADPATPSAPAAPAAGAPKEEAGGPAGTAVAPRVALGAATTSEAGSTPSPAVDDKLPPLPDEAGPRPSAPVAVPAPAPAGGVTPDPAAEATAPVPPAAPAPEGPPAGSAEERPIPVPQPDATAGAEPAAGSTPAAAAALAPAPEATPAADTAPRPTPGTGEELLSLPKREVAPSRLRPEQERPIVEAIARQEREEALRSQAQVRGRIQPEPGAPVREGSTSNLQTQTQYDIARAPSPAEARPIKAIPVPEDWVPLAPRSWTPQRKYWAAAATCHLPLYFQDPVLERYGHSVEQFVGPAGRYLTYPVDDPKQSTQRMQILQPVFSLGLFAFQIGVWPYTAIMDPPWEAQYDLGYYRPGDVVPVDVYWLPLHGYGPPLHGNSY